MLALPKSVSLNAAISDKSKTIAGFSVVLVIMAFLSCSRRILLIINRIAPPFENQSKSVQQCANSRETEKAESQIKTFTVAQTF